MQYHLVFTSDQKCIPYLFVATQSIVDHLDLVSSEQKDEMTFHVLVDESVNINEMEQIASAFVQRNSLEQISFSFDFQQLEKKLFADFTPWREKDNKEARSPYYRILVDQFLDTSITRALYLDLDIVVRSDIRQLFQETDLEGKLIAVAPDIKRQSLKEKDRFLPAKADPSDKLHLDLGSYFNTGVMLINLEEWRNANATQACIDMAKKYRVTLHAQDLINYVAQGKYALLDVAWNFTQTLAEKKVKKTETSINPRIVQFSPHKPWRRSDYVYPIPDSLEKYADEWTEASKKVVEAKDLLPAIHENEEDVPLFSFKMGSWKQKVFWFVLGAALFTLNIATVIMLFLK